VAFPSPPAPPPGASDVAGRQVGPYRLLTTIGEGGMGVVHLAQHDDGRRVALKVLRPHVVGDDEARARLAREVSSLSRIRSPRVAEIIDADPWGPLPYVATRYVPGLSLHQHVRTHGPIHGDALVWFAHALADALSAVHAVGVLHRDIKPSNVLLEGRAPILIDFGLARLAEDARITHTGWLLGTPGYLAPEILYGDDPTPAADVHAWAATLTYASTGRPPYGRGPAMAVMDRVRRGEHDLRDVDPVMRPLLAECLAPVPYERPSLPEVLDRLARWQERYAEDPRGLGDDDEPLTAAMPMTMPLVWDHAREVDDPDRTSPAASVADHEGDVGRTLLADADADAHADAQAPGDADAPADPGPTQRRLLAVGTVAAIVLGTAAAPVLAVLLLALVVLTLRTVSWTSSATRERRLIRGRPRWYDVPLSVASSPWYAAVASWGALVLMTWTGLAAFLAVLVMLLLGVSETLLLMTVGGIVAAGLWRAPGSTRVRLPARRLAATLTRRSERGWTSVLVLALLVTVLAWSVGAGEPVWDPAVGSPWGEGTLLGGLAR